MTADDDGMKSVPPIAIWVSPGESGSCVGETEVIVGTGLGGLGVTVNATLALVPPPGVGEVTETWCAPAATSALAGIEAASCVAPTNVVASGMPSQSACEAGMKSVPSSVIAVAALP